MRLLFFLNLLIPFCCLGNSSYHHSLGNINLGVIFNENRNALGIIDTVRFELNNEIADILEFYPQAKTSYPELVKLPEKLREGQKFTFEILIYGSHKDEGFITPIYREFSLPTKEGISIDFSYQYILVHEHTSRKYTTNVLSEVRGVDIQGFPVLLQLNEAGKPKSLGPVTEVGAKPIGEWLYWNTRDQSPHREFLSEIIYIKPLWYHPDSMVTIETYSMDGNPKFDVRLKHWTMERLDSALAWVGETATPAEIDKLKGDFNIFRLAIPKGASRIDLYSGKQMEMIRPYLISEYLRKHPWEVMFSLTHVEKVPLGWENVGFQFETGRYHIFYDYGNSAFKKYKTEGEYQNYLIKKYPHLIFLSYDNIDMFNVNQSERKALINALLEEPGIDKISKCMTFYSNHETSFFYDYITVIANPFKTTAENIAIIESYGFKEVQIISGSSNYYIAKYPGQFIGEKFVQMVTEISKDTRVYGAYVAAFSEVVLDHD